MLGLGAWELAMVLVVALVVLGPDKIPEVARKLARFVGQARRMAEDVRRNVDEALQEVQPPAAPPASAFTDWLQRQQERGNEPPEGTQAALEAPAAPEAVAEEGEAAAMAEEGEVVAAAEAREAVAVAENGDTEAAARADAEAPAAPPEALAPDLHAATHGSASQSSTVDAVGTVVDAQPNNAQPANPDAKDRP